jgi:hypothetical protein
VELLYLILLVQLLLVSANTTSGFSIVSWTGWQTATTVWTWFRCTPKIDYLKDRSGTWYGALYYC